MIEMQEILYRKYHAENDVNMKFHIARSIIESQKISPIPVYWKDKSLETISGETWSPLNLEGFDSGFEISSFGILKRLFRYVYGHYCGVPKRWEEKIMIPEKKANGRLRHKLTIAGSFTRIHVHQSVALTFVSNPTNELTINHIDGNPLNNHYLNLEWCSYSYNILHAFKVLGKKIVRKKLNESELSKGKIGQFDINGNLVKEYSCRQEAHNSGFNGTHITNVIGGKRKTHAGFIWKFLE
jgi:hypothetical protein